MRVGNKPLLSALLYKELHPVLRAEAGTEAEVLAACRLAGGGWDSSTGPATTRIKLGLNHLTHNILLLLFGLIKSRVNLPRAGKPPPSWSYILT